MSTRIGLSVGAATVRAVAVRDARVIWAAETISEGKSLAEALDELLATVPLRRWPRPTLIAAVGPAHSQLRRLTGLPPVPEADALTRLVASSAGRFFLRNGVPLVTTGILRASDDAVWGAAIEQPVVAALEAVCATHRLNLTLVVPSLAMLPYGLHGDRLTWRDGDVVAQLTLENGVVRGVRRAVGSSADDAEAPRAVAALAAVGEQGWRFADAYGAAVGAARTSLAFHPSRAKRLTTVPKWRLAAAGSALVIATIAALLAPVLSARVMARHAMATLSMTAKERRAAEIAEAELGAVSEALREVGAFDRERRSATLLLASLTRALPEGAALVTLRTDSAGGTIVALVPRAAVLMEHLERVRAVASPSILGPITREAVNSREVERVTLRFHWANAPAMTPPSRRYR